MYNVMQVRSMVTTLWNLQTMILFAIQMILKHYHLTHSWEIIKMLSWLSPRHALDVYKVDSPFYLPQYLPRLRAWALQTLVVRYGRFLALMLFDWSFHSLRSLQLCAEVCGSVDGSIVVVDVLRVTSLSSGDYPITTYMWNFNFLLAVSPFGRRSSVYCQLVLAEKEKGLVTPTLGYLVVFQWLFVSNPCW